MKRFFGLAIAALTLAMGLHAHSPVHGQTGLSWKFAKGDQFRLELDQLAKSNSEVINRKVLITNRINLKARWEVASVTEDGSARIIQVVDAVSMKMSNTNPEGVVSTVEVDSDKETKDKIAKEMLEDITPIIGQKVMFVMDRRGVVSEFDIPEETMKVLREAPSSMEIRKIFSAEGMSNIFGPAAVVLPEEEINAGHSWEGQREIENSAGKFKQTITYQMPKDPQGKIAKIKVSSKSELIGDENEKIKVVEQTGEGSMDFDISSGYLSKSLFKSTVQTETQYRDMTISVNTVDEAMFTIQKVRGD